MASTRAKSAPKVTPPPPPKAKKSRTNGAIRHQAAAVVDEDDDLDELDPSDPAEPSDLESAEDFWLLLPSLDWNFHICYLWRVEPLTDRRSGGRPTSIGKYGRTFDLETVMHDHGSGMYRADLCWSNPTGGKGKRIRQQFFTVLNMDYPPKVPYGDWLNDPSNAMWKWAEPKLRAASENPQGNGTGQTGDPNQMFNTVLNGIRILQGDKGDNAGMAAAVVTMATKSAEMMQNLNDPGKQLETIRSIITMLHPPGQSNGEALMITFLQKQLDRQADEMKELRQEIRNRDAAPRKSVVEEIREVIVAGKELRGLLGGKLGGDGTDWGEVISGVVDKVSDHVPMIVDAFKSEKKDRDPGATLAPPPRQVETRPAEQPATVRNATPDAEGPKGEPVTEDEKIKAETTRLKTIAERWGRMIQAVASHLIDSYKAGITGYEFRDWFIDRHGRVNWANLRDECGEGAPSAELLVRTAAERLTGLAMTHSILKTALAPQERLVIFLVEFFTPQGEEPADAIVEDDEKKNKEGAPQVQ